MAWVSDTLVIAAVAATVGCLVLVVACLSCWICKSRQRRKERIIRRNSIRASIRSNRSVLSTSSGGFSDIGHRRRIIEDPNIVQPTKGGTRNGGAETIGGFGATSNGTLRANGLNDSFNSIAKSNLNFSEDDDPSYVAYDTTHTPEHFPNIDARFAHDPDLENQNVNMIVKPTFDLAYQNKGFRDTSTFASTETSGPGFESREPSHMNWTGSNANLPGSSTEYEPFLSTIPFRTNTPSSFRDRSVGGSATQLGIVHPNTEPLGAEGDIHMTATLPRDTAPEKKFANSDTPPPPPPPPLPHNLFETDYIVGENPFRNDAQQEPIQIPHQHTLRQEDFLEDTTDSSTVEKPLSKELSQSQPLETAM